MCESAIKMADIFSFDFHLVSFKFWTEPNKMNMHSRIQEEIHSFRYKIDKLKTIDST